MRFATVIPLDYGFHIEEAVSILDTEWDNLFHLLQMPQQYIDSCRINYDLASGLLPWRLKNNAVCHLFEITESCPMEYAFLDIAQSVLGSSDVNSVKLTGNKERAPREMVAEMHRAAVSKPPFNTGFFMLRFAVDTGVMHVGYWAPRQPEKKYKGELTDITFAEANAGGASSSATFHIDLKAPAGGGDYKELQAQFILDSITDFKGVLDRANARPGHRYAPEMTSDVGSATGRAALRRPVQVPAAGQQLSDEVLMDNFDASPSILVENLSNDPFPANTTPCVYYPGCKCCLSPTGQTIYTVTEMVCKQYTV